MTDPVPLRVVDKEPNQEIVELLAELLEKAKKGEIQGIAIAMSVGVEASKCEWAGENAHTVIAATSRLLYRLQSAWCDKDGEALGPEAG